jgi:hypothetical protein
MKANMSHHDRLLSFALIATFFCAVPEFASAQGLMKVYQDESHCLTEPDMRGDKDAPISCYCRDAIVDARYVHLTYLATLKDSNLNGAFLHLVDYVRETCGEGEEWLDICMQKSWTWNGPEVVRTYPPDDVIKRIKVEPMRKGAKTVGRWVPYSIQLVYRNKDGKVTQTETYSSREFFPELGSLN